MASKVFERLPRLCIPLKYAIELKPCFQNFTFVGKQSVDLEVKERVSEIILNARYINITTAKFNGVNIEVESLPDVERLVFRLSCPALPGPGTLYVEYTGLISEKMEGFYRSSYADEEKTKIMLTTHFEPTSARQAFPCFDEPEFRSVFSIKLLVPKDQVAISNMPVKSKFECDGNLMTYLFEDTPKMSSYLVAFAIGELEYVESKDSNGVQVRVYARKGFLTDRKEGSWALNTVCRSLPFFGQYFSTKYPLPKADLLAVPNFAGGAMENWGLITFREQSLLVDNESASQYAKQGVAITVSHELAHMWFGNLVTMRWWTDLWLKEGFATWIEYLCVNHCYPEMEIWTHFTYGELAVALRLDALSSSHPIEVEVSSPNEIDEIFDTISYSKGSSVINMLHSFLGDEAFRAGLCSYLNKHAYNNATTEDLWNALTNASGVDVASLMRSWTQTVGFPVLKVRLVNNTHQDHITVELSQQQYKLSAKSNSSPAKLWPIPITLTCSTDAGKSFEFKHVLKVESEVIDVPLNDFPSLHPDQFMLRVNSDATGFYHTLYEVAHLKRLAKYMKSSNWSVPSRFVFINDGFALAKAGFIPISDWLLFLPELLENEDNYAIWRCVLIDGLATYVKRLVHACGDFVETYNRFLLKLARSALDKFGFIGGEDAKQTLSHNANLLRSLLISTCGAEAGDLAVINEAKRRFEAQRSGQQDIPNDLRASIYATVIRHGSADVVDYFMNSYESIKSPEERSHILGALGAVSDVNSLKRVLSFCLNSNGPVRDQDRIHGLCACASWSGEARLVTWETLKSDWSHISSIYNGQFLLAGLIKSTLSGFCDEHHANDIKQFFDTNPVSCPRAVNQVHETLEINQLLLKRDLPSIHQALELLANKKISHV